MAFVDYEKAFDSVETWALLESLQRCQADYRYIEMLKCLYESAIIMSKNQWSEPIQLCIGVKQAGHIFVTTWTVYQRTGEYVLAQMATTLIDDVILMAKLL